MKILVLSLLIVLQCISSGQAQSVKELTTQIDSTENDSVRLLLYARLAMQYRKTDPDTAFQILYRTLNLAKQSPYKSCLASAHNGIGILHFFQSHYDSCLYHYIQCLHLANDLQDSLRIGAMLNNIGTTYNYKAAYDTAIQILIRAYEVRKAIDDKKITSTINNLGIAYQNLEDWETALKYFEEAAELKELYGQKLSLSNTLNNIGIVLKNLKRDVEAIPYYEKSLRIAEEYEDKYKQANAHNNLASVYHDSPDLIHLAGIHYLKSIELKTETNEYAGLANSLANYAEWLLTQEQSSASLDYINQAIKLNDKIGDNLHTAKIYRIRGTILTDQGRHQEAYESLEDSYHFKIKGLQEDRNTKIAELQVAFEAERKEAEIKRLSLENALQTATLAKSRNQMMAVGLGSFMFIIVLVIYFLLRNKKLRAEREAQELQMDALKKRFMELHSSPAELAVSLEFEDLNNKLNTPLTEREFEALKLSIEGKSNSEISEHLFISLSTVKFHLRNTYSKMGVGNRKEAFQYMLKTS